MPHLELSFDLSGLDPDAAESACFDRGALAITLTDTRDDPVLEPAPGEVRLWPATRVQALFPAEADPDALRTGLREALGIAAVDAKLIEDKPWEREWLRDFHAMRFGERLWVCPHHEQVTQPDAVVVKLDPGLAFGTGTHPSTALCLTWLDAHGRADGRAGASVDTRADTLAAARVVDYGCGSGVLGIAAAKLGARVQAWDIDPQARLATEQNAAANDVAAQVGVCLEERQLAGGTDLLIANILANILCELAPRFAQLVRGGGELLLAGILESQADTVTAACAPWFDMRIAGQRESWVSLSGTRKQHVHSLS